jgi:3-hydroxyacyl-[acyl-carrier-protein] dehydratase
LIKNLYHIIEQNEESIKIELAPSSHPVFKAHFPGNPILPGFSQIEIIAQILNDDIVTIKYSKFLSHILPGDTVEYLIQKENKKTKIKILKDSKKVSEMIYESK